MHSREPTTAETKSRGRLVAVLLLLMAGWSVYMLAYRHESIMTLPDGSSMRFLEATEAFRRFPIMGDASGILAFDHKRAPDEGIRHMLWRQIPDSLRYHFPEPPGAAGQTVQFKALVPQVLWFRAGNTFNRDRWRFFWVDDQGYETEARVFAWLPDSPWIAFEGCVPRYQKHLHLRAREREGEQMAAGGNPDNSGRLGKVVADMQFRNPLLRKGSPSALTPGSLPATGSVGSDKIVLSRAVRSRIASNPIFGMRFELFLNDHKPIGSKYQLHDWIIQDEPGNTIGPINGRGHLSNGSQWWSQALWSDAPFWRVRIKACRYLEKHFETEEKFTILRMPLSRNGSMTELSRWREEHTVKGHRITVHDVRDWGPGRTSFRIHISPPVDRCDLVMLSATDETGNRTVPNGEGQIGSIQLPAVLEQTSAGTLFYAHFPDPPEGDHMTFTLGLEKAVPVEFTFLPEFEP